MAQWCGGLSEVPEVPKKLELALEVAAVGWPDNGVGCLSREIACAEQPNQAGPKSNFMTTNCAIVEDEITVTFRNTMSPHLPGKEQ